MTRGCASPMGFSSLLFTAALVLTLCTAAAGHGFLAIPKSRNLIAHERGLEYCHHCLSSGGPSVVSSLTPGGKFPAVETTTTAVRHAMCGEAANIPASQRKYNPSPVPTLASLPVYAPGQEFNMTVQMPVHHRGHFEFRLCDASKLSDPTTVTFACLNENVLQRVAVPGEISPVDVNYPERYYLEPECAPGYSKTIRMRYRMPQNLTCERCVLQWWWVTANSCNPPGYANRSPQPAHVASGCNWWQSNLAVCGTAWPEEFWNCADVRIVGAVNPAPAIGNTEPPAPASTPVAVAPPAVAPIPVVAPPAAPKAPPAAPPAAPKAPLAAPAAAPAVPKAPPAAPKAPTAPLVVPKAPPAAPKAPTAPPTAPSQTCAGNGYQCGGTGWTGPTCCVAGTQCYAYISTYSQCRTSCPVGWMCSAEKGLLTSAIDWMKALA